MASESSEIPPGMTLWLPALLPKGSMMLRRGKQTRRRMPTGAPDRAIVGWWQGLSNSLSSPLTDWR